MGKSLALTRNRKGAQSVQSVGPGTLNILKTFLGGQQGQKYIRNNTEILLDVYTNGKKGTVGKTAGDLLVVKARRSRCFSLPDSHFLKNACSLNNVLDEMVKIISFTASQP